MSGVRPPAARPATLLVVGIHREELAFGQAVAEGLDPAQVAVLVIPDGISGRRPHPDQSFHYETLHRALYRQLLAHMAGRHRLLIDLHTGSDQLGPRADLICADAALRACLAAAIADDGAVAGYDVRLIPLGAETAAPHARTVIPREVWDNPAFRYVGMEIYLSAQSAGLAPAHELARELVRIAARCAAAAAAS